MNIFHAKSLTQPDWTGTVTIGNSTGGTQTAAASDLLRPSDHNSAHNVAFTLSGNTNNASTVSGSNVILQGVGGVTLVGGSNSLGISARDDFASSNHLHGDVSLALTNLSGTVNSDSAGMTVSLSAAAAGGAGGGTATLWQPFNEGVNVAGQVGNASIHLVPLPTPAPAALGEVHIDRLCVPLYFSNASNSTGTVTISHSLGLYTRDGTRLSLAGSTSYSTAHTFSGTVSASLHHGIRLHTIPWTTTIGDGRYFVAQWSRTSTGGANASYSQMLVSQLNSNFSGVFGQASNRSNQWPLGYGVFSASVTTGLPNSIAFSQIDGTASLAARPPSFFMINGSAP